MAEEQDCRTLVRHQGHDYFQVDCDRRKGDRRSDGKLNSDFFRMEEIAESANVRASQRLQIKSKVKVEVDEIHEEEPDDVEEEMVEVEVPVVRVPRLPRLPDKCIKCAGRKRTSRLLWLHEFYIVNGNKRKKTNPLVYQSLQFVLGAELPEGVVHGISDRERREIWVLGVWYVPAERVRKYSKRLKGYMFHTELNDDDADKSLYGKCPELVRVENCLRWHPMSRVERSVPRVVHADDVKQRRIYVAGRAFHYVCGVTATEDLDRHEFRLSLLPRGTFAMYPEKRLGLELNSPSMMWEDVEEVFSKIRQCMSSARQGTSSATFKMPFQGSAYAFWKVGYVSDLASASKRLTN